MSFKKIAPLAAAALAIAAAPALADTGDSATIVEARQIKTTHVRFGDLDLSTKQGADRLRQRIRTAAGRVCGFRIANDLSNRVDTLRCRDAAIANAEPQVERLIAGYQAGTIVANASLAVSRAR
jgi:UrcA family protein